MRRVEVEELLDRLWIRYRLYDRLWHQLGGRAPGLEGLLEDRLWVRLWRQLGVAIKEDLDP